MWLLTRVDQMVFAAGTTVFPGGRVDSADSGLPWSGRPPDVLAARLGCDALVARALVGAAVRETFEETGVLLTDPPAGVPDVSTLAADVEAGRIQFGDLLRDRELGVARRSPASVGAVDYPRRRGAALRHPVLRGGAAGRSHAGRSHERVVDGRVVPVRAALAEGERGERILMPPTVAVLQSVAAFPTVSAVVAAARCARPDPGGPGASAGCRRHEHRPPGRHHGAVASADPVTSELAVRATPVGDGLCRCGARRQSRADDVVRNQHLGVARTWVRRRDRR